MCKLLKNKKITVQNKFPTIQNIFGKRPLSNITLVPNRQSCGYKTNQCLHNRLTTTRI